MNDNPPTTLSIDLLCVICGKFMGSLIAKCSAEDYPLRAKTVVRYLHDNHIYYLCDICNGTNTESVAGSRMAYKRNGFWND